MFTIRAIDAEVAEMSDGRYAKTASHSILGTVNDFTYFASAYRHQEGAVDLVALSLRRAQTPCGPLPTATSASTGSSTP